VTACYYCSRPEGAPHLLECPKAPASRIDWSDERLNASVRAFKEEAEQHTAKVLGGFVEAQAMPTPETSAEWAAAWHAAHRGCARYNPVEGTCVHVQVAS
jgi:hypothetical protein